MSDLVLALGKRDAVDDPRTPKMARYFTDELPPPPPAPFGFQAGVSFGMWGNDKAGDCVVAMSFNKIRADLWNARARVAPLRPEQAIGVYSHYSGYNPATGANDNGLVELDYLKAWRTAGILGHHITAFTATNPQNAREVEQVIYLFGGALIGAQLPLAAQAQHAAGKTWTVVRGPSGRAGSWGGHAMYAVGYTKQGLVLVTWGGLQLASWNWVAEYTDEAYAVLGPEWLRADGRSPVAGFDWPTLQSDLALVA